MPMRWPARPGRGFTTIELMVVVALTAILLAVAVPSFTGFFAKKRVESLMSELGTDLQYARSEAVARNLPVRLTFGTGCYVIHTQPTGASASSCSQADNVASTMGTNGTVAAVDLKTVKVKSGSTAGLAPVGGLTFIEFDPVRGGATWNGSNAAEGVVDVTSSQGGWQLRVGVQTVGRTQTCSPGEVVKGYPACS